MRGAVKQTSQNKQLVYKKKKHIPKLLEESENNKDNKTSRNVSKRASLSFSKIIFKRKEMV